VIRQASGQHQVKVNLQAHFRRMKMESVCLAFKIPATSTARASAFLKISPSWFKLAIFGSTTLSITYKDSIVGLLFGRLFME
jgi:hypothetical protein